MTRRILNPIHSLPARAGFTLVEMLIAMAITLVMIGAVVTLFANLSNSVRDRRAVVEMSGQLRHARNMLQQDLQGATCNGLVWQRPDENQGYIEIIEGPQREGQASSLTDADPSASPPQNWPPSKLNPEIDHRTSIIPSSNLPLKDPTWFTDGGGLGDFDDVLMLTVRNEHEPFVGRKPAKVRIDDNDAAKFDVNPNRTVWLTETIESPLAEVVWYAVENPGFDDDASTNNYGGFFGEPGMRTIYRRTLLIAPWVNPYRFTDSNGNTVDTFRIDGTGPTFTAKPGLVRILPASINVAQAIAGLIAFQERYDLSVRLEFDPLLDPNNGGRWKIVANTLGDLTKRENRYEHHFFRPKDSGPKPMGREFPFAAVSIGSGYGGKDVAFVLDPEVAAALPPNPPFVAAAAKANPTSNANVSDFVATYSVDNPNNSNGPYPVRPFAYVDENSTTVATARAMLNDEGKVIRVIHSLVPLSGDRKGEDVMLTDALGFDLRVYDPGAFLYGVLDDPSTANSPLSQVLEPTDVAWGYAYDADMPNATSFVDGTAKYPLVGQGAYVDLGYGFRHFAPQFAAGSSMIAPWFFAAKALSDVYLDSRPTANTIFSQLAPGYAVFDTWSFHYENDGVNEDRLRFDSANWVQVDQLVDEGTNGLDDPGSYPDGYGPNLPASFINPRLGPDDVGERETAPPYDKPLRGVQVLLRLYERDSRQIRQVSVNQSFVPE